jgi:hypothetical protein
LEPDGVPTDERAMTLTKAVIAALGAGAHILDTRPYMLSWHGSWPTAISEEAMLELVAADPGQLSQLLAWWQGHEDYMAHYRRALAAGDERNRAWWRRRFLEDYGYRGPFPDDPPAEPSA